MIQAYPQAPRASNGRRGNPIELTVLGAGWLSVAATVSYLALATPIVSRLVLSGRIASSGSAVSLLAAALIATIPVSLATAGMVRLLDAFRIALQPQPDVVRRVAGRPGPARAFAPPAYPERPVARRAAVELLGDVAFRHTPGDRSVRRRGDRWEVDVQGDWTPLELPARKPRLVSIADAARVRSLDRDFVVKVYAAVVPGSETPDRVPACFILRPDQILPYLAGLPSASPRV